MNPCRLAVVPSLFLVVAATVSAGCSSNDSASNDGSGSSSSDAGATSSDGGTASSNGGDSSSGGNSSDGGTTSSNGGDASDGGGAHSGSGGQGEGGAGAAPTVPTVRLLVVGDTGEGNDEQELVAHAMSAKCAAEGGCDAVLMAGDNFYDNGVQSLDDPLWISAFEEPYSCSRLDWTDCSALDDLRFYPVFGNHDCGILTPRRTIRHPEPAPSPSGGISCLVRVLGSLTLPCARL